MKITVAVIADFASVAVGDKLNVLGVFDTIRAPKFPARHALMIFAGRFLFEYEDGEQEHDISISLEDEDGKKIVETSGKIGIGKVPPGESQAKNIIMTFNNLVFQAPGYYRFMVRCGDEEMRVPLKLIQVGKAAES